MKMTSKAKETAITFNSKILGLITIVVAASFVSAIFYFQMLNTSNNSSNVVDLKVETLELVNEHLWYNQTGWYEAAVVVVNTGERDAVLTKITVRSVESPWSDIYYWKTDMGPPSGELKQTPAELSSSTCDIAIDGTQRIFQQASAEIPLKSGWTSVLYIRDPGNLTLNDAQTSLKATIAVFSESKLYYNEITIENTYVQQAGVLLVKENVSWPTSSSIAIVIQNTGTSSGQITAIYIGTSSTNLTSATVASPSLPATVNAGGSQSYTITYTWAGDTRYYFKFTTDTPAVLEFSEKSPMKTEELKITSMTFSGSSGLANNTIVLNIRNSGTSKVTVTEAKVNDVAKTWSGTAAYDADATGTITIYMGGSYWVTGNKYKVSLLSATGTTVAAYETTA